LQRPEGRDIGSELPLGGDYSLPTLSLAHVGGGRQLSAEKTTAPLLLGIREAVAEARGDEIGSEPPLGGDYSLPTPSFAQAATGVNHAHV